MTDSRATRLIVGCGYLGRRVAALWKAQGHRVHGTTRTRMNELRALGTEPVTCNVLELPDVAALPEAGTVLFAVAPDNRADAETIWTIGLMHLTMLMKDWSTRPRLIFISSTSVYGQTDGEPVDEAAATEPLTESGRALVDVEQTLLGEWCPEAIVLRFAGIYGPGRLLRRKAALEAGEPIAADPEGWLNLIHVEDGAAAVLAADERGRPGGVYNVSDNQPVRRRDFYGELARLLGTRPPTFAAAADRANRRVVSRRMLEDLGLTLRYPKYVAGLAASVDPNTV